MSAAAGALAQASNQANSLIQQAFTAAAFSSNNALFKIMANTAQATNKVQNAITGNQRIAAQGQEAITLGSQGIAGFGVNELTNQLRNNMAATSSSNQATLTEHLNEVNREGAMKMASQGQLGAIASQAGAWSAIGGAAGGVIGSILGGILGAAKGGTSQDRSNIETANLTPTQVPTYFPSHMSVNTNVGWVGGQVGNPMSVGATNFANQTVSQFNSATQDQSVVHNQPDLGNALDERDDGFRDAAVASRTVNLGEPNQDTPNLSRTTVNPNFQPTDHVLDPLQSADDPFGEVAQARNSTMISQVQINEPFNNQPSTSTFRSPNAHEMPHLPSDYGSTGQETIAMSDTSPLLSNMEETSETQPMTTAV